MPLYSDPGAESTKSLNTDSMRIRIQNLAGYVVTNCETNTVPEQMISVYQVPLVGTSQLFAECCEKL
jgi:hypothetical protein